jgi:uncharacterized protein
MKLIFWRNSMKKISLIIIIALIASSAISLEVPKLKGRINDCANVLVSGDESNLENLLRQTELSTGAQIVLLTIPSLENENLESYALKVAEAWQIGQKESDTGLLFLIALQEKKIRMEVGYGLEPIITDAKSGYIIRKYMIPEFQKGNFYQGIANGLLITSQLINQEISISDEELAEFQKNQAKSQKPQIPVGFLIFLFLIFFGGLGRRRRGGLLPLLFLGSMMGGGHSGRSGGFGGFSGGGGSFGGGGASGSW